MRGQAVGDGQTVVVAAGVLCIYGGIALCEVKGHAFGHIDLGAAYAVSNGFEYGKQLCIAGVG